MGPVSANLPLEDDHCQGWCRNTQSTARVHEFQVPFLPGEIKEMKRRLLPLPRLRDQRFMLTHTFRTTDQQRGSGEEHAD